MESLTKEKRFDMIDVFNLTSIYILNAKILHHLHFCILFYKLIFFIF